ncbi:MAG: GNAT family N-acetyltransferase [Pseudomonadota bacterium]|uniref:GNAT family N-acetyltransferase n=1 Tax=Gallaecimonas pentaromativorans TaxID=584787 RepID=UPI00067F560E|nr:GNAT family N-acetyltransferase [Gallaecimonas pentaromativorans]MED5525083.1 GNAT family N-acetyltransferase [Pseudomonadota bacterium]
MPLISTARLYLREVAPTDAGFLLGLLNEPGWLENIGDRGVRDIEGALNYIEQVPLASYRAHGFGLYLVCLQDDTPIGLCGLIQRDYLDCPDLGYALSSPYWGKGYGEEAALAVLALAGQKGIATVKAITSQHNVASAKLLEKIGFSEVSPVTPPGSDSPLRCFCRAQATA